MQLRIGSASPALKSRRPKAKILWTFELSAVYYPHRGSKIRIMVQTQQEMKLKGFLLAVLVLILPNIFFGSEPIAVYLTWVDDPASTMVVQWVEPESEKRSSALYLKQGEGIWLNVPCQATVLHGANAVLKRVFLQKLHPDTDYVFCLSSDIEHTKKYRFKTMPKQLFRSVRFVVGGDAYYHYDLFRKMNGVVAHLSPDFVVLGGDIAYAARHGSSLKQADWEWRRWKTFLKSWSEQMIDENGRLIPLVVAIGNHDTNGSYRMLMNEKKKPSLFFTFFPFNESFTTYRELMFGDYLALFLLDTGHVHTIDQQQTAWLKSALKESARFPYKMAIYHRPAYGAYGNYNSRKAMLIRTTWSPLFERYGLQVAFEHHNHVYSRSKPIKGGKIDAQGVLYLGEGAWGVSPRKPLTPKEVFYIEKSAQINSVYLVTIGQKDCHIFAIDNQGAIFDKAPPLFSR